MDITMQGISKAFGSNEVLRGVDFTLHSGEIHALMGENGAGKSTLMNILTGIHKADAGKIFVTARKYILKTHVMPKTTALPSFPRSLTSGPTFQYLKTCF